MVQEVLGKQVLMSATPASNAVPDLAAFPLRPEMPISAAANATADATCFQSSSLEKPEYLGTRPRSRRKSLLVRIAVPAALLAGWWYGATTGRISSSVLASPGDVLRALVELQQGGELKEFLLASLSRAVLGVSLGVGVL